MWYFFRMDTSLAAQEVRAVLRSAGFREWAQGRRGWRVDGDPQGGWVAVGCTLHGVKGVLLLEEYREVLQRAGFQVKDDPRVPGVLRVTTPD